MKRISRLLGLALAVVLLLQVFGGTAVFAREEAGPEDFIRRIGKETVLAALYEADIPSLRKAIDLGLVSCVELTQYYLDRIEAYNDDYNCFITICDNALDKAKACDELLAKGKGKGSMFGIPVVLKDNYHYKGYPMTNGHYLEDSEISSTTAQVVKNLLNEGAIVLAKTNMSTEAENSIITYSEAIGYTKGAYDPLIVSGGSSGGSAVATSLNFSPVGLGTDTNASLRYPAALAGCVSLRTTLGKLPMDGIKRLNRTRDVVGAITETVYEQALVLDAMSGGTTAYVKNLQDDVLEGMRFGVLKELAYPNRSNYLYTEENIDDEIEAAFAQAIAELESLGAQVVTISVPDIFTLTTDTITANDAASKLVLYNAVRTAMKDADVEAVIFPTYLNTPLRYGTDENGKYWNPLNQTILVNCTPLSPSGSMPEITIPIGFHSLGCGIGMEIAAAKNQEQLLLNIAYSYTSRFDHRVLPEGAPNLYEKTLSIEEIFDAYDRYQACLQQMPHLLQTDYSIELMETVCTAQTWCAENLEGEMTLSAPLAGFVELPQVETTPAEPEPEPIPLDSWLPYVCVGAAAVVAVVMAVVILRLAKKRRIRKKRQQRRDEISRKMQENQL